MLLTVSKASTLFLRNKCPPLLSAIGIFAFIVIVWPPSIMHVIILIAIVSEVNHLSLSPFR